MERFLQEDQVRFIGSRPGLFKCRPLPGALNTGPQVVNIFQNRCIAISRRFVSSGEELPAAHTCALVLPSLWDPLDSSPFRAPLALPGCGPLCHQVKHAAGAPALLSLGLGLWPRDAMLWICVSNGPNLRHEWR